MRTVLISGAGIAGPTLAYWLARNGFEVTVVERAQQLRSSGSPVDVQGRAFRTARRMGIAEDLRAADTGLAEMIFVNAEGKQVGKMNLRAVQEAGREHVELSRVDLSRILFQASKDDAEYVLGDSIVDITEEQDGVLVGFEHNQPRRFDLVIGADGLHSQVRRLVFGQERTFIKHMGVHIATLPLAQSFGSSLVMYNTPGRAVAVHPAGGKPGVAFMFRGPEIPGLDQRDIAQRKQLLSKTYAGSGWRVPELLDAVRAADDLYFDSVSRVRLPRWSRGRVALLGDAAACASLFGNGSSLAITGAHTLAEALAATADDHARAFHRYEAEHRKRVAPYQRIMPLVSALLIPGSRTAIAARNLAVRLWPLAAAAGRLTGGKQREPAAG